MFPLDLSNDVTSFWMFNSKLLLIITDFFVDFLATKNFHNLVIIDFNSIIILLFAIFSHTNKTFPLWSMGFINNILIKIETSCHTLIHLNTRFLPKWETASQRSLQFTWEFSAVGGTKLFSEKRKQKVRADISLVKKIKTCTMLQH